jgi:branched-chain amino acid transport system ATP-binding protein
MLGPNGAGKSTALKAVSGVLSAAGGQITEGDVLYTGQSIVGLRPDQLLAKGISLVPEGRRVFPGMTVRENLEMGAFTVTDSRLVDERMENGFNLFPRLKERRGNGGGQLSGGEQQMLAIGRALMTNPHLLILDEATEGLAPLVREEIWSCLKALREYGLTIIVIDKYIKRLIGFADQHTILEKGKVVWQGDSAQLSVQTELWDQYLSV